MRPLFYLLFVLSFGWMLGGCSDDKEELAAPEEEYEFREVLWMLDESKGDGMNIMEKKVAPYVLTNRTSVIQPFVYATDTIRPRCVFTVPSVMVAFAADLVLTLRVPTDTANLSRDGFEPLPWGMSTYEAQFGPELQELPGSKTASVIKGSVEPYTQLVCDITLKYHEVRLSYKLLFEEKHSGEMLEVTGSWKGYFCVKDIIHVDTTPLE